jgi:O-antigen ligase
MAWAAASLTWGIVPIGAAGWGLSRLVFMLLCGLSAVAIARRLDVGERIVFERLLVSGLVFALLVGAIERIFESPLRRLAPLRAGWSELSLIESYDRGLIILALLAVPATLALWRRNRWAAIGLWLGDFAVVLSFHSGAAKLAAVLGALVAALSLVHWNGMRITIAACSVLLVAFGPVAIGSLGSIEKEPIGSLPIPNSAHHRLIIWKFTADRIAERPILGWGYDSSRSIPGSTTLLGAGAPALPLHPHNGMLQWWLELGFVGAALGAALLIAIARAIGRVDGEAERAAALGLYVVAMTAVSLSFGIWQGWWVATLFLSAAALISVLPNGSAARR